MGAGVVGVGADGAGANGAGAAGADGADGAAASVVGVAVGFDRCFFLNRWIMRCVILCKLVPLLPFQGFVNAANALLEADGCGPACLGEAGDVHKFAGGAVGFGEVVLDGALEPGDLFDEVGEFFDFDVMAGAYVDGTWFVVGLHEEVAGVG